MAESKIDTALFVTTADTTQTISKDLETCFADWNKVMQSLRGHWQGDTSDNMKNTADAVKGYSTELLNALKRYSTVLKELAGIYDKTEKDVVEETKTLKFDNSMR